MKPELIEELLAQLLAASAKDACNKGTDCCDVANDFEKKYEVNLADIKYEDGTYSILCNDVWYVYAVHVVPVPDRIVAKSVK